MKTKKHLVNKYQLDGINCPDCLLKIEKEVSSLNGIANCSVNIITKILKFEITDSENAVNIKNKALSKIESSGHAVTVKDINQQEKIKETIRLEGISCPDCLQKIESAVSKLSEVESCSVNIITKDLSFTTTNSKNIKLLKETVIEKIKSVDHDIEINLDTASTNNKKNNTTESDNKNRLVLIIIGAVLFCAALVLHNYFTIKIILYIAAYILIGYDVVLKAFNDIIHGKVFDENFLIVLATLGAFCVGEFPEAVAVILLYKIGTYLEEKAVNKSRNAIKSLMDIKPEYANLIKGKSIEKVSPESIKIGNKILIKPGEKVPLDGVVIKGNSFVDTKAITGESTPRKVNKDDKIYSGSINGSEVLTVKVEKIFSESTISRILELVQNASVNKSKTETFFTKFARVYTPAVVIIALCLAVLPPLFVAEYSFIDWIYRALIFLVVSCPCAMVISIPLTFFGGIGAASKKGILIKGGNYIDALNNVETVIFDKTGTLTKGVFKVVNILSENGFSEEQILKYAAYAESLSNHPIAASIKSKYKEELDNETINNYSEISGHGISCIIDKKQILCGNKKLLAKFGVDFKNTDETGTIVYLAIDNIFAGSIIISDELKPDSKAAIAELKNIGIKYSVILSGDNAKTTQAVAEELSVDKYHAELLPEDKLTKLEEIEEKLHSNPHKGICSSYKLFHIFQKLIDPDNHKDCFKERKLAFVGDGINDAPVITRADVGIAMGGLGADAAIEAADVVLMNDNPSMLPEAIKISKKTKRIVYQNITFALSIKTLVLLLAAFGMATMWEAVFADVGVTILAVFNSLRILKNK